MNHLSIKPNLINWSLILYSKTQLATGKVNISPAFNCIGFGFEIRKI